VSLRKSPARTLAFMAAQRSNALKSTGPRTVRGKARVALNGLRHGRFAFRLTDNLARAGEREGLELYRSLLAKLVGTFGSERPVAPGRPARVRPGQSDRPDLERLARQAWCLSWAAKQGRREGFYRANPECPAESGDKSRQLHPQALLQIRIVDRGHRVGIAFWVRRRWRYSLVRRIEAALGLLGRDRKREALEWRAEPGLRWRRFRPGRPRGWFRKEWEKELRRRETAAESMGDAKPPSSVDNAGYSCTG